MSDARVYTSDYNDIPTSTHYPLHVHVQIKVPVTRDFLLFNRVDGLHVANYREYNQTKHIEARAAR